MIDTDRVEWFYALEPGDELAFRSFDAHLPRSPDYGRWYLAIVRERNQRGIWIRRVGSGTDLRVTPSSREWDVRPWTPVDDARELAKSNDQLLREWLREEVFSRKSDGTYREIPEAVRAELMAAKGKLCHPR